VLNQSINLWLGVVFENVVDADVPPHIVYKIRQNASFTANTKSVRDKYWHPGPPQKSSADAYYQFGFVWLQVTPLSLTVLLNNVTHQVTE